MKAATPLSCFFWTQSRQSVQHYCTSANFFNENCLFCCSILSFLPPVLHCVSCSGRDEQHQFSHVLWIIFISGSRLFTRRLRRHPNICRSSLITEQTDTPVAPVQPDERVFAALPLAAALQDIFQPRWTPTLQQLPAVLTDWRSICWIKEAQQEQTWAPVILCVCALQHYPFNLSPHNSAAIYNEKSFLWGTFPLIWIRKIRVYLLFSPKAWFVKFSFIYFLMSVPLKGRKTLSILSDGIWRKVYFRARRQLGVRSQS